MSDGVSASKARETWRANPVSVSRNVWLHAFGTSLPPVPAVRSRLSCTIGRRHRLPPSFCCNTAGRVYDRTSSSRTVSLCCRLHTGHVSQLNQPRDFLWDTFLSFHRCDTSHFNAPQPRSTISTTCPLGPSPATRAQVADAQTKNEEFLDFRLSTLHAVGYSDPKVGIAHAIIDESPLVLKRWLQWVFRLLQVQKDLEQL